MNESVNKHVVFIVLEINSASGICTKAVARELYRKGYKVSIIAQKEDNTEIDVGIDQSLIKARWFIRINNRYSGKNNIIYKALRVFLRILNKIKLILTFPIWPWISPLLTLRVSKEIERIHAKKPIDALVCVYTNIDPVIAGHRFKNKHPESLYIPYFLDSLSGGQCPRYLPESWKIRRGLAWESKLLKNADSIICMQSSKRHHQKYSISKPYYNRMCFLDIPLLDFSAFAQTLKLHSSNIVANKNSIIKIVYVGSLPLHIRDPFYFIELFKIIGDKRIRLYFVGTCSDEKLLKYKCLNDTRIEVIGRVSHQKAIKYLLQADYLLNIGNNLKCMVPSKIFEYMATGKPIISTYPTEDEPSLLYLRKYPSACLICESREKLNENLQKLNKFLSETHYYVNTQTLYEKMYANTPSAFVDHIARVSNMQMQRE